MLIKMAGRDDDFTPALRDFVIDNIRIGNQIGRGTNGRILEAKWEGIVVAVKEIHSIFMNEVSELEFQAFKRSFLRECEQSSRLRHSNIVRFFGIYHPPGARVPSLVMERLHCSLTSLLENNPVVPIGTKIWIIKDVALGLRYLHTRNPPIIHRDLSSNNVLLSKGMEGKIGDLGTARLVDPAKQSRMTIAPGTTHFMPPEALADVTNIRYGKELDMFSFGCVMLHTLSHEWPTASEAVIINPDTGLVTGGRSEVERRSRYFERMDNERTSNNELTVSVLRQEVWQKDAEIRRNCIEIQRKDSEIQWKDGEILQKDAELQIKNAEIQRKATKIHQLTTALNHKDEMLKTLRSDMSKLQITTSHSLPNKVSKQCVIIHCHYMCDVSGQ